MSPTGPYNSFAFYLYDGWWFIDKDCKEYDLSEEEEEEQEELDTHRKRLLAHQEDQQKPEKKPKQSDEEKRKKLWDNAMEETYAKPFWSWARRKSRDSFFLEGGFQEI